MRTGTAAGTSDGDTARSWYANVRNLDFAKSFKVFALCSASSDAIVEETTFSLRPGSSSVEFAGCPAGRRVTGGGVGVIAAPVTSVTLFSVPLNSTQLEVGGIGDGDAADSWAVAVRNVSSASPQALKVFALCSADDMAAAGAPVGPGAPPAAQITRGCSGRKATIVGTARADVLKGTPRADVIVGLGGNDRISGRGGNDVICGGAGADRLSGGSGRDVLNGALGRDRLVGGPGRDRLLGGPGIDKQKQ